MWKSMETIVEKHMYTVLALERAVLIYMEWLLYTSQTTHAMKGVDSLCHAQYSKRPIKSIKERKHLPIRHVKARNASSPCTNKPKGPKRSPVEQFSFDSSLG